VPHSIGWISPAMVRVRRPEGDLFLGQVALLEVLVHQFSLASAAASTIFSRHSLAARSRSAGISSK
jgi:hypothetical protein